MHDLATINAINDAAAAKAAQEKAEPLVVTAADIVLLKAVGGWHHDGFPYLGGHIPDGWRRAKRGPWFCDMGERIAPYPALTLKQLAGRLRVGMGYGVISMGQCARHLAEFERVPSPVAAVNAARDKLTAVMDKLDDLGNEIDHMITARTRESGARHARSNAGAKS